MWLKRHWLALIGALSLAQSAWHGVRWLIDLAESGEFVVAHVREPGWIGSMLGYILDPPPWTVFPSIGIGLALIWWDIRRTRNNPAIRTHSPGLSMGTPPKVPPLTSPDFAVDGTVLPREFTNRIAEELLAFYKGDLTPLQADKLMQPYKGLWMKVCGTVIVTLDGGADVVAMLQEGNATVECRFPKRWDQVLMRYNKGDEMLVVGRIGPSQNGAQLYLRECELRTEVR